MFKVGSYDYEGVRKYDKVNKEKNVVKKSKSKRIFLKTFTRPFKVALFPAASVFKSLYLNKKRLNLARNQLVAIGGEPLKLKSPDKTSIDGMYLSAETFLQKVNKYFKVTYDDNSGKHVLVMKRKYIDKTKEFSEDSFDHILEGEARNFCITLERLELGISTKGSKSKNAVEITLRDSYLEKVTDEARTNRPVALICPGRNMSYPGYKSMTAAYLMRGIDVMLFDYPGVGRSKGSPTDYNTKLATDTCYQYLREERSKNNNDIIAHGHSLGGAFATDLASRRQGVHVVVDRGFSSFSKVVADKKPKTYRVVKRILPKIANLNNEENLKEVEGHIAIIWGKKDFVIPPKHAKDNLAAAEENQRDGQVVKMYKVDTGHNGNVISEKPKSFDDFLEEADLNPGLFART